jgi:Pyridoxamine 5'-phosphate oxidase
MAVEGDTGADLAGLVRRVLDGNVYMVLATADADGHPWASPVFYAADGHRDLYWMSAPDVTHSRNIAVRPEVSIVVFDSRAPVGTGDASAVYMSATAREVPAGELDRPTGVYRTFAERGGRQLAPADLTPPAPYRLYRATVTGHSVVCPRSPGTLCAAHGLNYDHRTPVPLSP